MEKGKSIAHNSYGAIAELRVCCPDPRYRDGNEALKVALRLCEITNHKDPRYLMILAAAHAECGDFDQAIHRATQSVGLVEEGCKRRRYYESILKVFRNNEPWRLGPGKLSLVP
jgi:cytochrome c-type biogenesis protein CcmH/NrfG